MLIFTLLWLPRLDIYLSKVTQLPISSVLPVVFFTIFIKDIVWSFLRSQVRILLLILLLFSIFSLISIYGNHDFEASEQYFSFLAFTLIMAGLVSFFEREFQIDESAVIFFCAGILMSTSIYLDVFQVVEFHREAGVGGRGAGFAENPNFAILTILGALFVSQNSSSAYIKLASNLIFVPAAFLTGSRFGFIILGIYLLSQAFNSKKPIYSIASIFMTGASLYFVVSKILPLLVDSSSLYRRLTLTQIQLISSDDGRVTVIKDYFNEQSLHFFGHGLTYGGDIEHRAHNSLVNYLFDLGVLPGISFALFYILFLIFAYKNRSQFTNFISMFAFISLCFHFNNSILTAKACIIFFAFVLARCGSRARKLRSVTLSPYRQRCRSYHNPSRL